VYMLMQYSKNATIVDSDILYPYAHTNGQRGEFAAVTMEVNAGTSGESVLVVSGGSPVGHYWPMIEDLYAGRGGMTGHYLIRQAIDFGLNLVAPAVTTTTTTEVTTTTTTETGGLTIDPMLL
jgi:hypothetical protein